MLKVVQIQYSPESGARSALRLQSAFLDNNIESSIISLRKGNHELENVIYPGKKSILLSRIDERLRNSLVKYNRKEFGLFSFPLFGSDISMMKQVRDADIIYLHWVLGGFLNVSGFRKLANLGKPIVFIMHDMWSFTGGCHYSFSCMKYETSCENCQMLEKSFFGDFALKGFMSKLKFYKNYNNLFFVSPSKWLYNSAKTSYLLKEKPIFYIPNVLNTNVFKPFDKHIAKRLLNLDENRQVIAFGAVTVDNPYKGLKYLVEALSILFKEEKFRNLQVLVFGSGSQKEIASIIPFKVKFMGFLNDEYSAMLVYNAADVFIVPSIADNQPTTVQESLSCGTPVVGFEVGGIPDMIRHKENGYVARYKDAGKICDGIKFCLENNLRGYMLPEFELSVTLKKHLELINFAIQKKESISTGLSKLTIK